MTVYYYRMSNTYQKKTTAAQNEVTLSYHRVRVSYFLAVIFAVTVIYSCFCQR